jgi:hypothetical protein
MESVRKDIECCFGIIKARFRFLAGKILYTKPEVISAAMKTCVAFHNMCLVYDNLEIDISKWEDVDWEGLDPDVEEEDGDDEDEAEDEAEDEDEDIDDTEYQQMQREYQQIRNPLNENRYHVTEEHIQLNQKEKLKVLLCDHFRWAYKKGEIQWPRNMNPIQKNMVSIPVRRINTELYNALYSRDSFLRVRDSSNRYVVPIGKGLFSRVAYEKNETIANFNGEVITREEYTRRVRAGLGGYAVHLNQKLVLDCKTEFMNNRCMASYANSHRDAFNLATNMPAVPNCR